MYATLESIGIVLCRINGGCGLFLGLHGYILRLCLLLTIKEKEFVQTPFVC